ncbi:MAG: hypothetical protein WC315_08990, partial [Candidatus Omnitrophota bacterium]
QLYLSNTKRYAKSYSVAIILRYSFLARAFLIYRRILSLISLFLAYGELKYLDILKRGSYNHFYRGIVFKKIRVFLSLSSS